jgi:hypothetical protein
MTPAENQQLLNKLNQADCEQEFQQCMTAIFGPASHVNIHISEVQ